MDLKEQILKEQANKICQTYKIAKEEALERLRVKLAENKPLQELISNAKSAKEVYRTRDFKDFIKKAKKDIYYDLRTYQKNADNLADSHISTRERAPFLDDLFSQIDGYLKEAEVVLDLGGGLFPATFPFDKYPKLRTYIWVDKDKKAYELLEQENYAKVVLYNYPLNENPWEYYLPDGKTEFDLVFMLKLVPVMYRQHREQLGHIAQVPFRHALITGSKEAMVKKLDIQNRENRIITKFITDSGWQITKKIDLPNEFGFLVE